MVSVSPESSPQPDPHSVTNSTRGLRSCRSAVEFSPGDGRFEGESSSLRLPATPPPSSLTLLHKAPFPEQLFKTALRSSSVSEWLDAAAQVSITHSEEFAKRLDALVLRKWFVSHALRNRAVRLLGFVQGEPARETAATVLSALIEGSRSSAEPERFFFSRRRFENASAAIDAASQLGGEEGVGVLTTALGAKNRDLVVRAVYPLSALSAGPGKVLRTLVTFAERPGISAVALQDALMAIGTLNEEHAAPFLIRMLSFGGEGRGDLRVRREAGRALGAMALKLSVSEVDAIGELLHHSYASVRSAACYALSKFGQEARPALVSISRALDDHPPERFSLRLLEIVMKIKRPESRALLLSVKTDPRAPRVVRRAAERYWGQVS